MHGAQWRAEHFERRTDEEIIPFSQLGEIIPRTLEGIQNCSGESSNSDLGNLNKERTEQGQEHEQTVISEG